MKSRKNKEQYLANNKRLLAFKIIAISLPFLFIALLELTLRLSGYGHDFRLFVEAEKPGYYVMSPHISKKYFSGTENATIGNFEPFLQEKKENTFRIFVLGASTAIGYPYLHNGSFHRWLQFRLGRTFPEKNFEVINLSLTAINSYTLLDFAKALPGYQPDAVLVYAGHNEYYGALGVGATNYISEHPSLVRAVIELREFRCIQWVTQGVNKLKKQILGNEVDLQENLMKRMTGRQSIPLQSEVYHQGIHQYKENMDDLLKILDEQQIPVFISTLVSNEKDLPPFISDTTGQEVSASHHYQLAQEAFEEQEYTAAKQLFVKAKELDLLRFRAPEAMNDIIRELSNKYEHVYLVDAKAEFARYSPHGIIGRETLLEHVHPNLFGYALLSDAFYKALDREQVIADTWDKAMSFDMLWQQMPITEVDSLKGRYETMILKEGWPFFEPMPAEDTAKRTLPEALAGGLVVKQVSWEAAMEKLYQHYYQSGRYKEAMKVAEGVLLEYPHEAKYYTTVAKLNMRLKKYERAAFFYAKAFERNPTSDYAKNIAIDMVKTHKLEEALQYLEYINNGGKGDRESARMMKVISKLVSLKKRWHTEEENVQVLNQLALNYYLINQQDTARWFLQEALRIDPDDPVSAKISNQLNLE